MQKYMDDENLMPREQKGCCRGSKGCKDQLLISKAILQECKRRKKNLCMAWIDYQKAFDRVIRRKYSLGLNSLRMSVTTVQPVTVLVTSSPVLLISGAALFRLMGRSIRPWHKQQTKMCQENWRNCADRGRQKCSEKILPQRAFVHHEIVQRLDRDRPQASAVRERQLMD